MTKRWLEVARLHRGRVLAAGFLVPLPGRTPSEWVRTLLPLVGARDALFWARDRVLVRFSLPRWLDAELQQAAVLTAQHGRLATFPLTEAQLSELGAPVGSVLWLAAGELSVVSPSELERCPCESWLELGELERVAVEPLGQPPAREAKANEVAPVDVRRRLGVPALSELALRARESAAQQGAASHRRRSKLVRWLEGLFAPRPRSAATRVRAGRAPARNEAFVGMLAKLGMLWLWLLPHQRYLRRMQALFEQGDTLEALRHALPLGSDRPPTGEALALLPPSRRSELSLLAPRARQVQTVPLDPGWVSHLRGLYERAFTELERTGAVEHAAFVLAELLADVPRAIAWLERRGQVRLAAELADARELPAPERVRLWFLAKDPARAAELAVRHAAYADAVKRFEQSDPQAAAGLRLMWAEHVASSGHYLEAARIGAPARQGDALVTRWLELACAQEGPAAHSAWLLRLSRSPACAPEAWAALAPLLSAEHEDAASQRASLAQEFASLAPSDSLAALATPLLRALLRDRRDGKATVPERTLNELLARAPVLRADLPRSAAKVPSASPHTRELCVVQLAGHERGSMHVYDAVPVADGRTLVALGELGCLLLSRTGAAVAQWTREPVDRLVPSEGSHVLTLRGYEKIARLGRLDLATRRHTRWLDLELSCHADSFDGVGWYMAFASAPSRLVCLDARAGGEGQAHALWQAELSAPIVQLAVSAQSCDVLTLAEPCEHELWSYELPSATLRSRSLVAYESGSALTLAGTGLLVRSVADSPRRLELVFAGKAGRVLPLPDSFEPHAETVSWGGHGVLLWALQRSPFGLQLDVITTRDGRHLARVQLEGAAKVSVRARAELLVLADDLGRVVRLDLARGTHVLLRV